MGSRICVSIGRGRHRHLIAEYKHLAERGAQLVELRLDFLQTEVNLKRILAERPCPVVITCRRERDGGMWKGSEEQRLMLLRTAIVDGVDYVDLEDDIAGSIPRFGKTKRIVSYHNFHETPLELSEIHARLAGLQADVVKLATLANDPHDNLRMLRLVRDAKVPTVGLCMGEIGTPSRLLTGKFGSPWTYATFQIERTMAPGQLAYDMMRDLYRYEAIDADTEVFGVIADPVAHSMSPRVHNAAFAELGMNRVYVPFRELGIRGLSVTIPHKEAVLDELTRQDDAVQAIQACNTVLFRDQQRLGFNTDSPAAVACLNQLLHTTRKAESLAGLKVLVLGAGGVAKAVVFGLKRESANVVIANRTEERAVELANMFRANTLPWEMRHTVVPDLIVNCTPLGMHPRVNETPFDGVLLNASTMVFDTVYNPEQTLLIKQAREAGCAVVTGVEMFVRQAVAQFQHFTGAEAPVDVMRNAVRRAISAVRE
jgi:3-dehydroquinate dehydratase/shikimate dehydrogenase